PITAASTALGVTGFMKAALGVRLAGSFFMDAEVLVDFAAGFFVAITIPHIQSTKGNLCNLLHEQI
ncbi:MAG: hypothetical protein KIG22_07615, partial [Oxalobacter sp.]|nr:hypothetical protein [Oxalobacter sp.]